MFLLPFVFLCNAFIFALLLKERFKILITGSAYLVSFILSWVIDAIVASSYSEPTVHISISLTVNLWILLLTSIFVSSNNLLHKIIVALSLYFSNSVCMHLFINEEGEYSAFIFGFVYLLFGIILLSINKGPLQYFHRSKIDIASVISTLFIFISINLIGGNIQTLLNTDIYFINLLFCFLPFFMAVVCIRSNYSSAKGKEKDARREALLLIDHISADNFNTMLINIHAIRDLKLKVAGEKPENDPLLQKYCDNENINAVIATKTLSCANSGVKLASNISLNLNTIELLDTCTIINNMIDIAFDSAKKSKSEDKSVSLVGQHVSETNKFEIVYDCEKETLPNVKDLTFEKTLQFALNILKENIFKKPMVNNSLKLDLLTDIVRRNNGKMSITNAEDKRKIRITI